MLDESVLWHYGMMMRPLIVTQLLEQSHHLAFHLDPRHLTFIASLACATRIAQQKAHHVYRDIPSFLDLPSPPPEDPHPLERIDPFHPTMPLESYVALASILDGAQTCNVTSGKDFMNYVTTVVPKQLCPRRSPALAVFVKNYVAKVIRHTRSLTALHEMRQESYLHHHRDPPVRATDILPSAFFPYALATEYARRTKRNKNWYALIQEKTRDAFDVPGSPASNVSLAKDYRRFVQQEWPLWKEKKGFYNRTENSSAALSTAPHRPKKSSFFEPKKAWQLHIIDIANRVARTVAFPRAHISGMLLWSEVPRTAALEVSSENANDYTTEQELIATLQERAELTGATGKYDFIPFVGHMYLRDLLSQLPRGLIRRAKPLFESEYRAIKNREKINAVWSEI